jgi:hypothetical protein
MICVEEWAEIRRLSLAKGRSIRALADGFYQVPRHQSH